jgi:hypothetical protein
VVWLTSFDRVVIARVSTTLAQMPKPASAAPSEALSCPIRIEDVDTRARRRMDIEERLRLMPMIHIGHAGHSIAWRVLRREWLAKV